MDDRVKELESYVANLETKLYDAERDRDSFQQDLREEKSKTGDLESDIQKISDDMDRIYSIAKQY